MFMSRGFFYFMKYSYINNLAHQKCYDTPDNNTHILPEYCVKRRLYIVDSLRPAAVYPNFGRWQADCNKVHKKCISNQCHGRNGNPSYSTRTIIFIDNVGYNKLKRPQNNTTRKSKRKSALTKKSKIGGSQSEQSLK